MGEIIWELLTRFLDPCFLLITVLIILAGGIWGLDLLPTGATRLRTEMPRENSPFLKTGELRDSPTLPPPEDPPSGTRRLPEFYHSLPDLSVFGRGRRTPDVYELLEEDLLEKEKEKEEEEDFYCCCLPF